MKFNDILNHIKAVTVFIKTATVFLISLMKAAVVLLTVFGIWAYAMWIWLSIPE